jgi:hypothetical protein
MLESQRTAIQGNLEYVKKDFHLEIKSKGGKCKECNRRGNPSSQKSKDRFLDSPTSRSSKSEVPANRSSANLKY